MPTTISSARRIKPLKITAFSSNRDSPILVDTPSPSPVHVKPPKPTLPTIPKDVTPSSDNIPTPTVTHTVNAAQKPRAIVDSPSPPPRPLKRRKIPNPPSSPTIVTAASTPHRRRTLVRPGVPTVVSIPTAETAVTNPNDSDREWYISCHLTR